MADDFDTQYREQTKRAETTRATLKAWVDVWLVQPLRKRFSSLPRWFEGWPKGWWVIAGLITVFVLTLGSPVLWHLYKAVWSELPPPGSEQFGRLGTQVAAAIGGAVGLAFLFWRTWLTQRQTHIANETLYTQLLTKAVEQLGATREEKETHKTEDSEGKTKYETITRTAPNIEVRIGAIYALEKIAQDYLPLHWQVMEILCSYIRNMAGPPLPETNHIKTIRKKSEAERTPREAELLAMRDAAPLKPRLDVQTALTVIGRRPSERRTWENGKSVENGNAYRLDLRNCHLAGADLDRLSFARASFDSTNLQNARLMGTHLEHASLREAHMQATWLVEAHLESVFLVSANLESAILHRAHLHAAYLDRADFTWADLDGATLEDASLKWANFRGADLCRTRMRGANLYMANLECASLEKANLNFANLDNANISAALIFCANLLNAKGLTDHQLLTAWGTPETYLPEGATRPTNQRWLTPQATTESNEDYLKRRNAHKSDWNAFRATVLTGQTHQSR